MNRVKFLECKNEPLVRCSGCSFKFAADSETHQCPGCGGLRSLAVPLWADQWTLDECAECLPIPRELSARLYRLLSEVNAAERTPLGGDGSDGTVETPDGRLNPANPDKLHHHWNKLSVAEQTALVESMGEGFCE